MAYPCKLGDILHGTPMERSNMRVSVDSVKDHCKSILLQFPSNEEVTLLGQAEGSFVQWPKRDVLLDATHPPSVEGVEPRGEAMYDHPEPKRTVAPEAGGRADSYPHDPPMSPARPRK